MPPLLAEPAAASGAGRPIPPPVTPAGPVASVRHVTMFPPVTATPAATWRYLPHWLACAFVLRATVALAGDFVLHPDEIMQHLEPAHGAVFGNGYVFWEWFLGARNWLVPGLVAGLLWLAQLVGLGEPWFYVGFIKLFWCLVALLVPWGTYRLARHLYDEQGARVALVLVCLWPYLVAYAHKPFTEFVATSLLFGALGLATLPACRRPAVAVVAGLGLGLVTCVRLQYAPVVLVAVVALGTALPRRAVGGLGAGLGLGLASVAILETVTWGSPFHSYITNLSFNLSFDSQRVRPDEFHYVGRLLYASAGLVILAGWVMLAHCRRHLFMLALLVVVILPHQLQEHKEFRFLFVTLPVILAVAGHVLAGMLARQGGLARSRLIAVGLAAAGHCALVLLNQLPYNGWLHYANATERGQVHYLHGQSNLWRIYRDLAADGSVKGVLHFGDNVYNTPGYYYLHHAVPFYDETMINEIAQDFDEADLKDFVTHIVYRTNLNLVAPGFDKITFAGEYSLLRRVGDGPIHRWDHHRPHRISDWFARDRVPPAIELLPLNATD